MKGLAFAFALALALGCGSEGTGNPAGDDSPQGTSGSGGSAGSPHGTSGAAGSGGSGGSPQGTGGTDHGGSSGGGNVTPTEDLAAGQDVWTFSQMIDGEETERTVLVAAPPDFTPGQTYPVLFAFHGNGGNGPSFGRQFDELVQAGHFIGVFPSGHLNSWNVGPEESTADDVGFVEMIVARLQTYRQVNADAIFAMGSSNGSGFTLKMGMLPTSPFKALAAIVSGLQVGKGPDANTPVASLLQINGDQDRLVPHDGGIGVLGNHFMSAVESAQTWASHDGCAAGPEISTTADGNEKYVWSDCDAGTRVILYTMVGHGHGGFDDQEGGVPQLVWDFFAAEL